MARPLKDGVDYFPLDTDLFVDDKVRLLRSEFGARGMYLLIYLLSEIYGKEGYYIQWDKNRCLLVSDGAACGCSPEFVDEFVRGCIRCSFFDERVASMFGVLTSPGIQRRYVRMFNSRDFLNIEGDYFLLDVSDAKDIPQAALSKLTLFYSCTENPFKSTENPVRITENTQSKVKVTNVTHNRIKVTFVTQKRDFEKEAGRNNKPKYNDWDAEEVMRKNLEKTYGNL